MLSEAGCQGENVYFFSIFDHVSCPENAHPAKVFEFPKDLDLPPATNGRFTKCVVCDLDSDGRTHYVAETVYHEVTDDLLGTISEQDQII